ncbi:MAG: ABC transporter permease [Clostridia bacterium]|nr:ABC transporter permease [Clostridia bacterium]
MRRFIQKSYMGLVFGFLYLPIAYLIFFSFNSGKSKVIFSGFSFKNYVNLFQDEQIMQALLNTLIIAAISSVVATILGTMAAIGIQRLRKLPRNAIMNITYMPVLNPDIITGVSMMLFFSVLGISLGYGTVLLAHITFNIPYVILAISPKLRQMDVSVYEAAMDLGASPTVAFRKAILPQIMPGIISGFMMALTLSVDDFVVTFFLKGVEVETLATVIYTTTKTRINLSMNALCGVMVIVVLIILIIANLPAKQNAKKREE